MDSSIKKENIVIPTLEISDKFRDKINIGKGNIFHPAVIIETQGGEINIGNNNIFEEKCRIYNLGVEVGGKLEHRPMTIGNNNYFKVGSKIFVSNVGSLNVINEKVSIEPGCDIGDGCVISAASKLPRGTKMDKMVYSSGIGLSENIIFDEDQHKKDYVVVHEALANQLVKNNRKKRR